MKSFHFLKKIAALIFLLSALNILNAVAQEVVTVVSSPAKTGYIGIRYQPTVSDFQLKNEEGGDVSTSMVISHGWGGELGFYMSHHFALQLEVLYNKLAQDFKAANDMTQRVNMTYVNVPLLLVFNTNSDMPVNLNICAGPQMGFNTDASITHESGEGPDTVHAVLAVKKNDVGIAFGAGLDFLLGPSVKFSVGYRGVQGLVDISDDSQNITTDDYYVVHRSNVRTNAGYAGLAIRF